MYLLLLIVVGVIPMGLLCFALHRVGRLHVRRLTFTALVCMVFYLPLDMYATEKGVWSFGPSMIGNVGPIPVEEVLWYFFIFPIFGLVYEALNGGLRKKSTGTETE